MHLDRQLVRSISVFERLSDADADAVAARLVARRLAPGEQLFAQGQHGRSLAIVLGGALLRRVGGAEPLGVAAWMAAVAAPLLLALSVAQDGIAPLLWVLGGWRHEVMVGSAYSGLLSGLMAYAIWTRLFGRYETHRVAPFMLFVPVGAIALSATLLGEQLTLWRAAAAATILSGLALSLVPTRRAR